MQVPGLQRSERAAAGSRLYNPHLGGVASGGPAPPSHWWRHKELTGRRCDWPVMERAELKRPGPTWGAGLGGGRTRAAASARKARKKKKNHTHRHKKTEVSLLISRQPRYAGRARGFQRARLARLSGRAVWNPLPVPGESPAFPRLCAGQGCAWAQGPVCSPTPPRTATFCGCQCVGVGGSCPSSETPDLG